MVPEPADDLRGGWPAVLPRIVADGLGLEDAAAVLQVSLKAVETRLQNDRALREAVAEARRTSGRSRGMRVTDARRDPLMLTWGKRLTEAGMTGGPGCDPREETFLAALGRGLTIAAAAGEAGIPVQTIYSRRRHNAEFDALVLQVLRASGTPEAQPVGGGRGPGPASALTPAARTEICRTLRTGGTLREAAAAVGVKPQTIKRARYADPEFDRRVVAAGLAGGRRFTRLTKPPCPGPKCGTDYGYDTLGCREPACRTQANARRKR